MSNKLGMLEESIEEYHDDKSSISKHALDTFRKSPFHYWAEYINPDRPPRATSPAMLLGQATHCAVLEPDTFPDRFIAIPDDAPRRPTSRQRLAKKPSTETIEACRWWDDFMDASAGKTILDSDQWDRCIAMRDAANRHPVVRSYLSGGIAERSFYAMHPRGVVVKCRPDYLNGQCWDLKTCRAVDADSFAKDCALFRYHVAAGWYTDVLKLATGERPPFRLVAMESDYPYSIGIYEFEPDDVARGRQLADQDLCGIIEHRRENWWPDPATLNDGVVPLAFPAWARQKEEFSLSNGAI